MGNYIRLFVFCINTLIFLLIINVISNFQKDLFNGAVAGILFFLSVVINYRHGIYQAKYERR